MVLNRPVTFGENLKYYRTKNGFTQKQLAERLGYTEKSVSKWESGGGMPTIETLICIADMFNIPLDELVFEKTSCNYFLGIDGGATKTAFRLTDENGTVIADVCKDSCNPNDIGIENATAVLKEGINEVCRGISYSSITMFAGISGGGLTGDNVKILHRFFEKFGFFAFDNSSDIDNLVALSDHKKCILAIMGTGFIVYAVDGNSRKRIAGWGQFFDEGGSGYTIGRDAVTAALCEIDGSGKKTALTSLLEKRFGQSAEAHLAKLYQGGKRYIASVCDLVFLAAEDGDEVALEILDKNMAFVASRINTAAAGLSSAKSIPVLFSGGISSKKDILFPLIEKHLSANCTLATFENAPVDGALRRAKAIFKTKTEGEKPIC